MDLNERKILILKSIINSFIEDGEAVGSRTISKKFDIGVSSATIRNEMSDLEELGFLVQPHTSAGRIPTDKAYRYYVNILKESKIKAKHINLIKKLIEDEINEMESFLKNSVKLLSHFTNHTSFAVTPQLKESKIRHIQLVPVSSEKIVAVIVTQNDIIKNLIFNLDKPIPASQLNRISNLLTEKLAGIQIKLINDELMAKINDEINDIIKSVDNKINDLLRFLISNVTEFENSEVYYDGLTNMFNFPEYRDAVKAKEFLSFMENRSNISKFLMNSKGEDISIYIGDENDFDEMKSCSIVTATYKLNGVTIGKIGVIGPKRMDYNNVISMVKALSYNINRIIDKSNKDKIRGVIDEER